MHERRTLTIELEVDSDVTPAELEESITDSVRVLELPGGEQVEPMDIEVNIC